MNVQQHATKHLDTLSFPRRNGDYILNRGRNTKYAYGRLQKNWQNAEDAIQSTYLILLENPPKEGLTNYEFEGLFRLVLNRVISNSFRSDKAKEVNHVTGTNWLQYLEQSEEDEDDKFIQMGDDDASTEAQALAEEMRKWLDYEIGRLKTKPRNICFLSVIYGYKPREIADITGYKPLDISDNIRYFRNRMKEKLNEHR